MKKKLSAILVAIYLLAGCSSGGGVSGAGGIGTATAGGLLLSAALAVNGSISVDAFQDVCTPAVIDPVTGLITTEAVLEEGITSRFGTFTVTITNISDLSSGLDGVFPTGIVIESYQVDYGAASDSSAPVLTSRVFSESSTILGSSATGSITVALVDLGFALREFAARNIDGTVFSYNISVTIRGRTVSGDPVVLTAFTFIEMGNFDRC